MGTITEIHVIGVCCSPASANRAVRTTTSRRRRKPLSQMVDNVLSQPEGKRLMLRQSLKSAKANTPKRCRTWQARVTSVLVLMA
ncbi:hypothetical protein ACLK1T_09920 [Escherichia coli]